MGRTINDALGRVERVSLTALSLHNLLSKSELQDEARLAWVIYLDACGIAEELGESLGVEVTVA